MIDLSAEADAEWFTEVLRGAGVLPRGHVVGARHRVEAARNSCISRVSLRYSPDASPSVPPRLLLKSKAHHEGAREIGFYEEARSRARWPAVLVSCYYTQYDRDTGSSLLLLEDLSSSHAPPVLRGRALAGEGIPAPEHLSGMLSTLAEFHALCWEDHRLGDDGTLFEIRDWYRDRLHFERHVDRRRREWREFTRASSALLPRGVVRLYEGVLEELPRLWVERLEPRLRSGRALTLGHGDCYAGQFLCPRDPAAPGTRLIDFDSVSGILPAFDLVYLIPTFWTGDQRREGGREESCLKRYQEELKRRGLVGYEWPALYEDYRLMLSLMIFDPVWDCTNGSDPSYWLPKLHCLVSAFEDHRCRDLFGM